MSGVPSYDELPVHDGARVAWHVFGPDDSVGSINLQTPERVRAAAREVRTGTVFSLDLPWAHVPQLFDRTAPEHRVFERRGGETLDDVLDGFYPQHGSQWDSLAHVTAFPGRFYNNTTDAAVRAGTRCTIDHVARRGIAGRGVVLDVEGLLSHEDSRYRPDARYPISVDHLEATRMSAGVGLQPGDILLIHTGWLAWYLALDPESQRELSRPDELVAVGLARSEDVARYLWDHQVSAVATDAPALEVWPACPDEDDLPYLHTTLIGRLGLCVGELWRLDALVADCRDDGRYTSFVTSAPCPISGGIGSPANALAVK